MMPARVSLDARIFSRAEKDWNDPPIPQPKIAAHVPLAFVPAAFYDLMVFVTASQVTGFWRKYDSFAIWHAMAALLPNTASSVTGLRDFTDWKNTFKCGRMSSQS